MTEFSAYPELQRLVIGLGAQKAGTSWLAQALRRHPQVHLPRLKELHFFDHWYAPADPAQALANAKAKRRQAVLQTLRSAHRPRKARDALWLARYAHHGVEMATAPQLNTYARALLRGYRGQPVAGEFTPNYSALPARHFATMAALHSDVRFVLVLRDPVDRLWSGVRHDLRRHAMSDSDALAEARTRFACIADDPSAEQFRLSDYAATFAALDQAVAPDKVCVLFFETLRTADALDRLAAFLQIAPLTTDADKVVNKGVNSDAELDQAAMDRARLRLSFVYDEVRRRFGDRVPTAWR